MTEGPRDFEIANKIFDLIVGELPPKDQEMLLEKRGFIIMGIAWGYAIGKKRGTDENLPG